MNKLYETARRPAHGRSLIELMVGILIGSLVLAGVMVITAGSSSIGRRTDSLGDLSDAGQTGVQLLATDVRMAGYSMPRTYFAKGYVTKMLSTAGIRGCDNGFIDPKVTRTDFTTPSLGLLTCNPSITSTGSALSLAYEADPYNSIYVTTSSGTVPSDCRGIGLVALPGLNGNLNRPLAATDPMSDSPAYWLVENRYYIANSTDGEPSLVCAGNGGTGNTLFAATTLIRGVERMVVSYGVAGDSKTANLDLTRSGTVLTIDDPSVSRYMTAKQIDEAWPAEDADMRWQRVASVRLCLVTRGAVGSAAAANATSAEGASYINCEGETKAIEDGRARRAVRMTINLRNKTMSVSSDQGLGFGGS